MPQNKRQFQFGFSLLSLLLMVSLVGAILAYVGSSRELESVKGEFRQMLDLSDIIEIDDPTRVYCRQLPQPAPLVYPFKVAIPAGEKLMLQVITGKKSDPKPKTLALVQLDGQSATNGLSEQYDFSVYLEFPAKGYNIGVLLPRGTNLSKATKPRHDLQWLKKQSTISNLARPFTKSRFPVESIDVSETLILYEASEAVAEDPRYFKIQIGAAPDEYWW